MSLDFETGVKRGAIISDCGRYRYRLWREWDATAPTCCFVMLNPSTADADVDDPTIRRCIGFARREGCGRLDVVNLFAWRATDPGELRKLPREQALGGQEAAHHAIGAMLDASVIICAWGSFAWKGKRIDESWMPDGKFHCLGKTKNGCPRHPLYVRADTPLEPYP